MLFSKCLQCLCCLSFIFRNYIPQKLPYNFNNDVLFDFLNMYNLKFWEKNLCHQIHRKKWQTPENDFAIAIKD